MAKSPGQNTGQRRSRPQPSRAPAVAAPHAPISPAREAAFAILARTADTSAHSDDLLHAPAVNALSQPDRDLATTLVLGVLRWQIALDALLQTLLQRPDPLPTPVAVALRLGAFQILHLDRIPAYAALSESVELARVAGHGHAAGMVNAVLRKLTRLPPPRQPLVETTHALAQRLSHPLWLLERWQKLYGRSDAIAICEADQQQPAPGALFLQALPEGLPQIDDGSRLVAELAAASSAAPARIWDCCAAPGGKTSILSYRHPQAELLASDINPKRLSALASRLRAVAPAVRTLQIDAAALPLDEGMFDLILCDVPCSGTGTLGRNPEIKQRLQPTDLGRQATRQREIISAALQRLAPGGRLIYSTCSLEPEENEDVVAWALATSSTSLRVQQVPLDASFEILLQNGLIAAPARPLLRNGYLRTLPGAGFAGDGFFAAMLSR